MQIIKWYHNLIKPDLLPPEWMFALTWSVLYLLIMLSFLFFIKKWVDNKALLPIFFFLVQLGLVALWHPVFFGMREIGMSFVVICFVLVFVLATILSFWKHSKTAAILLIPYFLWVIFALYLNFELLRLN